jgi:uncharacterized protein with FMN-binding domain
MTTTEFSISLQDDIITAISAEYVSGDHEDERYHRRFAANIANKVVGKKISEIDLDTVGGASLTTEAFMNFITSL